MGDPKWPNRPTLTAPQGEAMPRPKSPGSGPVWGRGGVSGADAAQGSAHFNLPEKSTLAPDEPDDPTPNQSNRLDKGAQHGIWRSAELCH